MPVGIDVERPGARDALEVAPRNVDRAPLEAQGSAHARAIDEQRRRPRSARQEHVGPPVAVAVERGDAAADEILPRTPVVMDQPRGLGLLVHVGHVEGQIGGTIDGQGDRKGIRMGGARQQEERGERPHSPGIRSVFRNAISSERARSLAPS